MPNFDINIYIIARENWFHPCKIGREPCGTRLISYTTPAGHRALLLY